MKKETAKGFMYYMGTGSAEGSIYSMESVLYIPYKSLTESTSSLLDV